VDGLAAIEKMLTADALAGWLAKAKGESVYVTLPRFKITQDFRLNDALEALGMTDAFSPHFSPLNKQQDCSSWVSKGM
jgi:serine protease inhibitor